MIEIVRAAVRRYGSQKKFADEAGIKEATLSQFLNEKADVKFSTVKKVFSKAGLEIADKGPNDLMQRKSSVVGGCTYHVGEFVSDSVRVVLCFGSTGTSKQGVVLKNVDTGEHELHID